MKPETLSLLCNPYKGEPFNLDGDTLVGITSGDRFEIKNGIPHIIDRTLYTWRERTYQQFYNSTAIFYDAVMRLGENTKINEEGMVRKKFISEINVIEGGRVLETSIGTGLNIPFINKNVDYYGVDISKGMLRQTQKNLVNWGREAELFLSNGAYLPFRDNAFDGVFQMGSLQFYGDPFRGVSEMARVAKPGSQITILDEQHGAMRTLKRMPAHARYSGDKITASEAMVRLVPHSMENVHSVALPYGNYYALSFQKPSIN